MTDQPNPDPSAQLAAQLAALQQQMAALQQSPAAATPAASPWASAPTAAPQINGVAVPVKMQTPAGSIRLYFSLPAECAATPEALMAALESMAAAGLPLDTWSSRESGSGWGGSRRDSYASNRGGWKR
ncbi:hypothetical protein [Imhoffiella purpurea]|uniref:Uncharacterized protein n=1 Tax=Imhoffiella purpurea TaxID=1249627 RepID=W9W2Z6_9GAMM|nr:hypothetical protein [Imhoffiella purpurea]EXJ16945.1 hypothetical protein D779_1768 [Imhoffiella purpurea]